MCEHDRVGKLHQRQRIRRTQRRHKRARRLPQWLEHRLDAAAGIERQRDRDRRIHFLKHVDRLRNVVFHQLEVVERRGAAFAPSPRALNSMRRPDRRRARREVAVAGPDHDLRIRHHDADLPKAAVRLLVRRRVGQQVSRVDIGDDGVVHIRQLLFTRREERAAAGLLRDLPQQRLAFHRHAGHAADANHENRRLDLLTRANA